MPALSSACETQGERERKCTHEEKTKRLCCTRTVRLIVSNVTYWTGITTIIQTEEGGILVRKGKT